MTTGAREKGITAGVWSFGPTWTNDLVPVLKEIGYSSMAQTVFLAFKFGEAHVEKLRFESLQSRPIHFMPARKPEDIWLSYSQFFTASNFTKKPKMVIIASCHYFRGPSDRLVDLAQALNYAGIDVILQGEPGSIFDEVFIFADIKIRAHEPCQYKESSTHEICGRQALKRVWCSIDGKSPVFEFALGYLEHFLSVAKLLRLEKAVRALMLSLRKIDVRYPKIPIFLAESVPEIVINFLFVAIYGFLEQENRCRAHLPGKELSVDQVGEITTFIGSPNARKSFGVASRLEQIAGGKISTSNEVRCFSALDRGSDSTLVGYAPTVITRAEEITVEGAKAVSFDEAELFEDSVLDEAIALSNRSKIAIFFALYGLGWGGNPVKNAPKILEASETIITCWSKCFVEGCNEIATRTALMSVVENQIKLIPGSLFPEALIPMWIKTGLGIKIVATCLNHCDQATIKRSFELIEVKEPKSDLERYLHFVKDVFHSIMEDVKNGRASAIAFLTIMAVLLLFPDLSYTIWGPLHKFLVLLMSVAFVLTISAVCDLVISQKVRKKRQKAAYVTLGFATILILLATLYFGLEPVIKTVVSFTAFALRSIEYALEITLAVFYAFAGDYLQQAEIPREYAKLLVIVSLVLLSLTVIYICIWTRRRKKARKRKMESKKS